MKTIPPTLHLALLAFVMLFSACEKEVTELKCLKTLQADIPSKKIESASLEHFNGPEVSDGFDFLLLKSDCFSGGVALEARLKDNAQEYAFLWKIDDQVAGRYAKTSCICGHHAKISVTRLQDGAIASKTTKLLPCKSDI